MLTREGENLQGIYENNYFYLEKNFHVCPFMDQQQMKDLVKNKNYINKIKESNYKRKLF